MKARLTMVLGLLVGSLLAADVVVTQQGAKGDGVVFRGVRTYRDNGVARLIELSDIAVTDSKVEIVR